MTQLTTSHLPSSHDFSSNIQDTRTMNSQFQFQVCDSLPYICMLIVCMQKEKKRIDRSVS